MRKYYLFVAVVLAVYVTFTASNETSGENSVVQKRVKRAYAKEQKLDTLKKKIETARHNFQIRYRHVLEKTKRWEVITGKKYIKVKKDLEAAQAKCKGRGKRAIDPGTQPDEKVEEVNKMREALDDMTLDMVEKDMSQNDQLYRAEMEGMVLQMKILDLKIDIDRVNGSCEPKIQKRFKRHAGKYFIETYKDAGFGGGWKRILGFAEETPEKSLLMDVSYWKNKDKELEKKVDLKMTLYNKILEGREAKLKKINKKCRKMRRKREVPSTSADIEAERVKLQDEMKQLIETQEEQKKDLQQKHLKAAEENRKLREAADGLEKMLDELRVKCKKNKPEKRERRSVRGSVLMQLAEDNNRKAAVHRRAAKPKEKPTKKPTKPTEKPAHVGRMPKKTTWHKFRMKMRAFWGAIFGKFKKCKKEGAKCKYGYKYCCKNNYCNPLLTKSDKTGICTVCLDAGESCVSNRSCCSKRCIKTKANGKCGASWEDKKRDKKEKKARKKKKAKKAKKIEKGLAKAAKKKSKKTSSKDVEKKLKEKKEKKIEMSMSKAFEKKENAKKAEKNADKAIKKLKQEEKSLAKATKKSKGGKNKKKENAKIAEKNPDKAIKKFKEANKKSLAKATEETKDGKKQAAKGKKKKRKIIKKCRKGWNKQHCRYYMKKRKCKTCKAKLYEVPKPRRKRKRSRRKKCRKGKKCRKRRKCRKGKKCRKRRKSKKGGKNKKGGKIEKGGKHKKGGKIEKGGKNKKGGKIEKGGKNKKKENAKKADKNAEKAIKKLNKEKANKKSVAKARKKTKDGKKRATRSLNKNEKPRKKAPKIRRICWRGWKECRLFIFYKKNEAYLNTRRKRVWHPGNQKIYPEIQEVCRPEIWETCRYFKFDRKCMKCKFYLTRVKKPTEKEIAAEQKLIEATDWSVYKSEKGTKKKMEEEDIESRRGPYKNSPIRRKKPRIYLVCPKMYSKCLFFTFERDCHYCPIKRKRVWNPGSRWVWPHIHRRCERGRCAYYKYTRTCSMCEITLEKVWNWDDEKQAKLWKKQWANRTHYRKGPPAA